MTTITIETENFTIAKKLAGFLKMISSVRSVVINDVKEKPLTAADWVRPGRPATDKELEQLAWEMENDETGEDSEIVFSRIKKGLKR